MEAFSASRQKRYLQSAAGGHDTANAQSALSNHLPAAVSFLESTGITVISIVTKLAVPPMKFETGSARKTPFAPRPLSFGSSRVRGMTMITFLKIEKNTACFDFPRATKVDCPENCSAIIKIPKK